MKTHLNNDSPNPLTTNGNFRNWVQNMWYDHLDELMTMGLPPPKYALKEYFAKYKYWLRREYKHQRQTND